MILIISLFLLFTDMGRAFLLKSLLFISNFILANSYIIFVLFLIYFKNKMG